MIVWGSVEAPDRAVVPGLSATGGSFGTKTETVSGFVEYMAVQKTNTVPVLGGPIGLARRAAKV